MPAPLQTPGPTGQGHCMVARTPCAQGPRAVERGAPCPPLAAPSLSGVQLGLQSQGHRHLYSGVPSWLPLWPSPHHGSSPETSSQNLGQVSVALRGMQGPSGVCLHGAWTTALVATWDPLSMSPHWAWERPLELCPDPPLAWGWLQSDPVPSPVQGRAKHCLTGRPLSQLGLRTWTRPTQGPGGGLCPSVPLGSVQA